MFKEISVRVSGDAAEVVRRLIESQVASGPDEAVARALERAREGGLKPPPEGPASKARGLHLRLSAENTREAYALVKAAKAEDAEQAVDWALRQLGRRGLPTTRAAVVSPPKQEAAQIYSRKDFLRCFTIALVVGTALVLINVRPTPGEGPDGGRIVLNYMVPFIVATSSAILANHARIKGARHKPS